MVRARRGMLAVVVAAALVAVANAQWSGWNRMLTGTVDSGVIAHRITCGDAGVPVNNNGIYEWGTSADNCATVVTRYVGVVSRLAPGRPKLRQRCNEYNSQPAGNGGRYGGHLADRFQEVLRLGHSMCYRWHVYDNVHNAGARPGRDEESRLLGLYDYPWNAQAMDIDGRTDPNAANTLPGAVWHRMIWRDPPAQQGLQPALGPRRTTTCAAVNVPNTAAGSGVYEWGTSANNCGAVAIKYVGKADRHGGIRARCENYMNPNGLGAHHAEDFTEALDTPGTSICYRWRVMGTYVPPVTEACRQEPLRIATYAQQNPALWNVGGIARQCQPAQIEAEIEEEAD